MVSASAIQILLDSLVVAQPFQSGGSQSDDLLLAFEKVRDQLGEERSAPDYILGLISKRVDNPKRLKNKCELIAAHRYAVYMHFWLIFVAHRWAPSNRRITDSIVGLRNMTYVSSLS